MSGLWSSHSDSPLMQWKQNIQYCPELYVRRPRQTLSCSIFVDLKNNNYDSILGHFVCYLKFTKLYFIINIVGNNKCEFTLTIGVINPDFLLAKSGEWSLNITRQIDFSLALASGRALILRPAYMPNALM